jgi:YD repeat-containing protein
MQEGDSISYRFFQYDQEDRIISITDSNNNGNRRQLVMSYDAQGKLSQVTEGATIYKFEYDNKGRIAKKLHSYSGQQTSLVSNNYIYDLNGRVIADSSSWSTGFIVVTYSYDAAGNVTASKSAEMLSGISWVYEQQCSYDDHPNPLAGNGIMIYLFDSQEGLPAGNNNLLKETFDNGTVVNYKYDYHDNGLPKKSSFYDNTDPLVTYVDYYYQ